MLEPVSEFHGLTVTFIVTENCNLRCKYCYEINKKDKYMSLETAKKMIDSLLNGEFITKENIRFAKMGIVLEFMGGDALINPKLVDSILNYWTYKLVKSNTKWAKIWRRSYRVSICSNGTLFERQDVREFCEKWQEVLCLTVSIDGCPEIHDKYRVFPDGRGTMSKIREWLPWYQKNFPTSAFVTKSTCSKATIPYLYESLKFMHEELGLIWINQNFIMEPTGCTEEDYKELDRQMKLCIKYVFEHRNEMYWSMIGEQFSKAYNSISENKSRCGSGNMLSFTLDGKVYACMRWAPLSLGDNRPNMSIGTVDKGLTHKGKKIYKSIYEGSISKNNTKKEKCKTCEYESACAYCIAGCFTEFGDFTRTTHICEITKILCENAKIYKQMEEEADGKKE